MIPETQVTPYDRNSFATNFINKLFRYNLNCDCLFGAMDKLRFNPSSAQSPPTATKWVQTISVRAMHVLHIVYTLSATHYSGWMRESSNPCAQITVPCPGGQQWVGGTLITNSCGLPTSAHYGPLGSVVLQVLYSIQSSRWIHLISPRQELKIE